MNSTLEKMVLKVDRWQAIENDIVLGSKAKFIYRKDKNYAQMIKKVIEYIKELPFQ